MELQSNASICFVQNTHYPIKTQPLSYPPNNESLFSGPLIQMMAALFTFVFIIPRRDAESVQNLTNRDSSRCALLSRAEK
ncbi:hypothetical protein TNIN_231551 [Trichonephila inaurata madagascariensis]|uniref:Uncharacterized protein n=1 Tax=Trichonephila inaurata madagascariensis TaxID=2747483 RepID=A0A8X6WMT5_9ARAC|nr:hypothetical protein TNIN_231551 [Trichonephila inaurata madagascariensis]